MKKEDVEKEVMGIVENWKEKCEVWEKEVSEGKRSEKGKSSMMVDVKKKMELCKILKSGDMDSLVSWGLDYCREGLNSNNKLKDKKGIFDI